MTGGRRRLGSLRRRVVVVVALIVLAGVVASGVAAVAALRGYLQDRTDEQLATASAVVADAVAARPDAVVREALLRRSVAGLSGGAAVHLLADGAVVATVADGEVVPPPPGDALGRLGADPVTVDAGGGTYRAVAVATPGLQVELADGTREPVDTVVLARDLADDVATVERLVGIELAVGALVAAASLGLTWWAVGAGLGPLGRMAAAAREVAAGRAARMPPADVAETRELAAALDAALDARERAETRLRDFVADAAHELRTPLTSVHGWAELYQQGVLDGPALDRAMERIEAGSTRMRRLVDQMALLARLDADVPRETADVDLAALVDDVLADLDVVAPGRPVRWSRPSPVVVAGDGAQLTQVVQNLVGNVLRHTPPDAGLDVRLEADGGTAVLVVADGGPGLPPGLAGRAFDRFARGPAPGGAREGSGLGLAIVAGVVAAHGGTVALDSRPGDGTRVVVRLPLRG